jgi:hypothetical protein
MARGQTAAQIFGQLGQGIGQLGVQQGALGEAAQGAAQRDVNALFNVGALEQAQRQAEYDVQRSGAIEEAYEPFQRFSYMSDIFRGVPSTSQTSGIDQRTSAKPCSLDLRDSAGIELDAWRHDRNLRRTDSGRWRTDSGRWRLTWIT